MQIYYNQLGEGAVETVRWGNKGGTFKGFGFVVFTSKDFVDRALALRPPKLAGKQIEHYACGKKGVLPLSL